MYVCILSPPKKACVAKESLIINNTDFAPLMLDMAGVEAPDFMQGRSFATVLDGKEPAGWRTASYYRYWMHRAHHDVPAHFGLRSDRYKLIFFYGMDYTNQHAGKVVEGRDGNRYWNSTPVAWEFYDLEKDPLEMHNRYSDPAYKAVIGQLKEQLKAERETIGDTDADHPRIKQAIAEHWDD